jgi:hypothetical protein
VPTNALSSQLATLLARQRSYTRSAEIIFVPTDALSPQLAILLAQQCSYTRSAEIISIPTDALSILTDASGTTPSPDMLRGLASSTHTFAPALATHSGAAPCIGIYSPRHWQYARGLRLALVLIYPGVGNTLGACASHWYSFAPTLATRSRAACSNPMLATHSGATPYAVNFSSLLDHRRRSVCYVNFGSTHSSSTPKTLRHVDSGPPCRQ